MKFKNTEFLMIEVEIAKWFYTRVIRLIMTKSNWIMSSNSEKYDHAAAFERHGYIDWKQKNNFQVGDWVFIRSKNSKTGTDEIEYVGIVEKTDIPFEEALDDTEFWKSGIKPVEDRYFRIRLMGSTSGMGMTREAMIGHGLKKGETFQSPKRLCNLSSDLEDFIIGVLDGIVVEPFDVHEMDGYPEGSKMTATVNRYERDSRNRKACIDHYGCRCQVCEIDFGKRYGPLATGFIHVHHIVPVSELGDDYIVNPVKDLIPLCPNCHAMVHRLRVLPEVLKKIIRSEEGC